MLMKSKSSTKANSWFMLELYHQNEKIYSELILNPNWAAAVNQTEISFYYDENTHTYLLIYLADMPSSVGDESNQLSQNYILTEFTEEG